MVKGMRFWLRAFLEMILVVEAILAGLKFWKKKWN
jgi:hypothetical protein